MSWPSRLQQGREAIQVWYNFTTCTRLSKRFRMALARTLRNVSMLPEPHGGDAEAV